LSGGRRCGQVTHFCDIEQLPYGQFSLGHVVDAHLLLQADGKAEENRADQFKDPGCRLHVHNAAIRALPQPGAQAFALQAVDQGRDAACGQMQLSGNGGGGQGSELEQVEVSKIAEADAGCIGDALLKPVDGCVQSPTGADNIYGWP